MTQDLTNQNPSAPCTCYCCRWDRAHLERVSCGLKPFHPPGMPMYTAAQLLDCSGFMVVGPVRHDSAQSAEFWRVFGDHLLAWLREEVLSGRMDEPEPAKYGATSLLMTIESGSGPCTDAPREPYTWVPLGGRELLFDGVVHGLMSGWDERIAVDGLTSFLGYLDREGAIASVHAQAIQADLAVWVPRFLEAMRRS